MLIESLKGAVILAILERLYITRTASWFEDHIGAFSGASFTLSKSFPDVPPRLLLHSKLVVQPWHSQLLEPDSRALGADEAHQCWLAPV